MKYPHVQVLLITDDVAVSASVAELLAQGNADRDRKLMLTILSREALTAASTLALTAQQGSSPAYDVLLVDQRGIVEAQTLHLLAEQLPACPWFILGDEDENLENSTLAAIWQQVGANDYLLHEQLTSYWLRHLLLRATVRTPLPDAPVSDAPVSDAPVPDTPASSVSASPTSILPTATPATSNYADQIWRMLDSLFADIPVIVCAFTGPDHVYRYANALYIEVVGGREVVGKPIREALPELEGQNIYELLDEVYATGKAYTGQEQQVWLRNKQDGVSEEHNFTLVFAPISIPFLMPTADVPGTSEVVTERMIFVIALDVSELVRLRGEWQEAHAQLDALFASAPLGLAFVDRELHFLRINPALAAMNGLPAEVHVGNRPDTLLPDVYAMNEIMAQWRQIIETGEPVIGVEVTGRTAATPDQDQTWEESWFPITLNDEVLGLGVVAENITQRKHAETEREHLLTVLAQERRRLDELNQTLEERVHERSRQVRRLASELTLAEQRERHRIAQILHDHIQQLLYGIDFRIALLTDSASTDQFALLQEFKEIVQEAIRATRTLAVDLSPPVLQGEGLAKALHWLVHQLQEIHELQVTLDVQEPLDVAPIEMRVLILQSVRELLFNVVKHADTATATVIVHQELRQGVNNLVVQIADDGRGFEMATLPPGARAPETFGLYSIRERLHLFDGLLDVDSVPGNGTRVTIVLPVIEVEE